MKRSSVVLSTAVASVFFLATASTVFGQAQIKEQQSCLNNINKAGVNVAKQQGKEQYACLRAAGKNDLVGMTAQDCLTADVKGRVQKKRDKTAAVDTKYCGGAGTPDFGFTGSGNANFAAETAELQLIADVFGSPLEAAVIDCDVDKPGCLCQQKVFKSVEGLAAKKAAEFLKCKKAVLKAGGASATVLANCVEDAGTELSLAADTKGRIAKAIANVEKNITKACVEEGVTLVGVFPGECDNLTGTMLRDCLDTQVECRVCQMINDIDGLWVNCDQFDNGVADSSCDSGVGPEPTPTPEPMFGSGAIIKGVLPPSNGLFTYAGTPGLAGADSLCNTHFPGTTHCTFAELEAAEAAGELVGAVDINSNNVTSMWVIDGAQPNNKQCADTPGVLHWNYATVHNGNGGLSATLNNGTGALGAAVNAGCTQSHRVGCCL